MIKKFMWHWDDAEAFDNRINELFSGDEINPGIITCLRSGEICIDIEEGYLNGIPVVFTSTYVGGIDSGYGYRGEYPYDELPDLFAVWMIKSLRGKSCNEIRECIENNMKEKIENAEYKYCSLIDKAAQPLKIW